jgi:hypothetical protein
MNSCRSINRCVGTKRMVAIDFAEASQHSYNSLGTRSHWYWHVQCNLNEVGLIPNRSHGKVLAPHEIQRTYAGNEADATANTSH